MSSTDVSLKTIARFIEGLESDDAFERRNAIESLALLTQQRLDFAWRDTKEERRRKQGGLKAAVELLQSVEVPAAGPGLQEALEKAFKDLPPEHKKALIAQMLAKVAASAASLSDVDSCERCNKRPATVKITSRVANGEYVQRQLCEVCAAAGT